MISIYPIPTETAIDYAHQKTHEGRYFSGGFYNSSVANGANHDVLIQNGAQSFHMRFDCSAGGDSTIRFYEATTFSVAGSAVTMSNHNRSSAKTFVGTVTSTPTITTAGNQINGIEFIPGGIKNQVVGGSGGFANEFILLANTNYLIRVTNDSGSAIKINTVIYGYQPNL